MADSQSRHEEQRIDTGRITLNVRIGGSGPLMLFFHGITANSAVFGPLMDAFSDRFTTVAVDQRGHGRSDKPETGYEAIDYADDIAALIKTLDMGPAILVGHSLGSRNSVTAAQRHPELVRSVAAIDFTPYIEDEVFASLSSRVNAGDQFGRQASAHAAADPGAEAETNSCGGSGIVAHAPAWSRTG